MLLNYRVLEHRIGVVFQSFRGGGIEPILIKGWAAAAAYPEPFRRIFSDIDLAVSPYEYARARKLAADNKVNVDLHSGLRHLDTVSWESLFENSLLVPTDGVNLRVLRPEDHLRVLCVHWLNDGGTDRHRLWDIFYAVENRPHGFDWGRCLDVISRRRRRWVIATIGLAHRYCGLKIDDLPFRDEAQNLEPWLIRAVEREWGSGARLRPLRLNVHNWAETRRQLRKRLPPNPIQATIELEGDFEKSSRLFYQLASFAKRIIPSLRSGVKELLRREKIK